MRRELDSDDGPEGIQLLLDSIANSQEASSEAPDSSNSRVDSPPAA